MTFPKKIKHSETKFQPADGNKYLNGKLFKLKKNKKNRRKSFPLHFNFINTTQKINFSLAQRNRVTVQFPPDCSTFNRLLSAASPRSDQPPSHRGSTAGDRAAMFNGNQTVPPLHVYTPRSCHTGRMKRQSPRAEPTSSAAVLLTTDDNFSLVAAFRFFYQSYLNVSRWVTGTFLQVYILFFRTFCKIMNQIMKKIIIRT